MVPSPSDPFPLSASIKRRLVRAGFLAVASLLILQLSAAGSAQGQDWQLIAVGNGFPDSECVTPGSDGTLDSSPSGDDTIVGSSILSGANGICETPLAGDDTRPPNGVLLGKGAPNARIIVAGQPASNNGICDDAVIAAGDDIVRIGPGQSEPNQIELISGANGTLDTTPTGDDLMAGVICPGADDVFQTVPDASDLLSAASRLCDLCPGSVACIIPGTDGLLQTSPDPLDDLVPFLSTGPDGVADTAATNDDSQVIAVGDGLEDAVCVDAGADGIAQTTLCGNGIADLDEDGIPTDNSSQCDDGNTTAGDGCSDTCQVEFCGDGIIQAGLGEQCDDANTNNKDDCLSSCLAASCGDGFRHTQGTAPFEQCDDGNLNDGDGCDSNCTSTSCGNGIVTSGEQCDDGNLNDGDGCDSNCTSTSCGNGIVTSGEQCDDGNLNDGDGCSSVCVAEFCGDGIIQSGLGEQCDDGNSADGDGCDSNCTSTSCGNGVVTSGEQCDDGNLNDGDGCSSVCVAEFCGDGIIQSGLGEQCDDAGANSDTTPDACRTDCALPSCGDAISDPGNGEECDDGNTKNNDACVLGCKAARCGDGFKYRGVEECDDGNTSGGDGCSTDCLLEQPVNCGNGTVEPPEEECDDRNNSNKDDCLNTCRLARCSDGFQHNRGTPPFEECDDGNTAPGDGCSADCKNECGNGVIDGVCTQGTVGAFCQSDADCDSAPLSGDGACATEECDFAIDGLCLAGPTSCSNACLQTECGNGEVECGEQCDLAGANGVPGSGCTVDCKRSLIGRNELRGRRECPSAWTLDSPPADPRRRSHRCKDGSACDFDTIAGQCTFRVGICLNRPEPATCKRGGIVAFDLRRLDVEDPVQAAAVEAITSAVRLLSTGTAEVPDRCRRGLRLKVCSIPNDGQCDSSFGAGDGICDIGTGVLFTPPLDPADLGGEQASACTPGVDIVVPVGDRLRLLSRVRREVLRGDKDALRLRCLPAP